MANTVISLKKSATPAATPSTLANGELAINYADGKLFYKAANGTIVEFASGGGAESSDFGTVNVGGTLLVSDVQGDILTITAGDNIVLTPDAGGDSFSIAADLSGATDFANNKFLANTTGTFDGDLTVSGNTALRNSTTPTSLSLYGTYTDASNYERLSISANATGSFISTEAAGTGTGRNLYISGGGNLTTQGELLLSTALVSVKHRTFALGHSSKTILYSPSDGLLRLSNDAQNDFNRLQFGGTSSSYPSIKRNGTSLEVKLADDSDYTDLAVENLTAYGNVGIGTASPGYELDVNGTINGASYLINGTNIVSGYITPAFTQANTALTTGQAAFGKANTADTNAINAFGKANTAGTDAVNAFSKANTACTKADTAQTTAVSAFSKANTALTTGQAAFGQANSATTIASAAFDQANTGGGGGAYYSGNNGDTGEATGLGDIFRVHSNTLTQNVTIYSGNNALAAGPITVDSGKTITIQTGARMVIA